MKKVLILIPSGNTGGIEIASFNLINIFIQSNYDVKVIKVSKGKKDTLSYKNEEILLSNYKGNNILKKVLNIVYSVLKLRKIKKKYNPDYTISNGDYCNTIDGLTFSKEKRLGTVHSIKSIEIKNQGFFGKFCFFGMKYLYKNFDKIICISEGIKQDLIENFKSIPQNKLEVIYNYHDFEKIEKLAKENLDNSGEEELFNKNNIILSLGRVVHSKAPWHLIKSFSLLLEKNPNLKLVFIGPIDKKFEDTLKELSKLLKVENLVFFLGGKKNPYKYLKRTKVLAMTSYFEGLPNVIVEALALDIPVISTDSSLGIWEAIAGQKFKDIDFKQNGVFFSKNGIIVENFKKEESILFNEKIEISQQEKNFSKYLDILLKNYSKEIMNTKKEVQNFEFEKIKKQYLDLFAFI